MGRYGCAMVGDPAFRPSLSPTFWLPTHSAFSESWLAPQGFNDTVQIGPQEQHVRAASLRLTLSEPGSLKVDTALTKILGVKAALWRPPYGAYNSDSVAVVKSIGYDLVYWSDDSGDSVGKSVAYSDQVYDKIAQSFPKPHLVLNHETCASPHGCPVSRR